MNRTMTKRLSLFLFLLPASLVAEDEGEPLFDKEREANSIILDEIKEKNLRIETADVEERTFETTVFAIGRIAEIPSHRSVLSTRIPGRIVELNAFEGDTVTKGQVLARVESQRPGDPPPTIDLLAPASGLVVNSHMRLGEPVDPSRELLDISDRSKMWAVAQVPEKDAPQLPIGSTARIRIPGLGDERIEATIIRYGVRADQRAGALEAIFELDNEKRQLQPGMRAEFSLVTSSREDVLTVPRRALQGDPSNRVVYIKDFELPHVYHRSPVIIGEQNEEFVEVLSGVFLGDEVVTRGSYSLGFVGKQTGMSLKEYLDQVHGHEHNEDGSELTPEQQAAREAAKKQEDGAPGHSHAHGSGHSSLPWIIYGGVMTLLFLATAQLWWRARNGTEAELPAIAES